MNYVDNSTQDLDRPTWRPIHTRISIVLGVGWMLDAFEVNIVGSMLDIIKNYWDISSFQASLTVSVWLVGIMIGALLFGYLADCYGRRKLFVATLALYSIFTAISAISPGFYWFLAFRFLTALGVGAEYSAVNAAISELIPARYRGRANAVVLNFWPLGALLAGLVSLYVIHLLPSSIAWRIAFALGAVIGLFALWARRLLPESPRWLARRGREEEAHAASEQLTSHSRRVEQRNFGSIASANCPGNIFRQIQWLVRYCPDRLALGCALDFAEAFGYYGLFTLLPLEILPKLHIANDALPWFFIIGNIGGAIGGLIAAAGLDSLGRKHTVVGFYVLAGLAAFCMSIIAAHGTFASVLIAFTFANLAACGTWVAAYPTFSELFPTHVRATGIGFSVAVGRIGASIAPALLILISEKFSIALAFYLVACVYLIGSFGMFLWSLKGPEGCGRPLEALVSDNGFNRIQNKRIWVQNRSD